MIDAGGKRNGWVKTYKSFVNGIKEINRNF